MKPSGYVYFLALRDESEPQRDLGLVKIGITSGDVMRRVSSLQTGNPYDLLLFDAFETPWPREVEHFMHRTHAQEMLKPEWLRCPLHRLPSLVQEARKSAVQIANRKRNEQEVARTVSNGRTRRATPEEFELHREVRKVFRELVPAKLALRTSEARLHAATGATLGVPGIVRVKWLPSAKRFDINLARSEFSREALECTVSGVHGAFRWRGIPKPHKFPDRYLEAVTAEESAAESASALLRNGEEPRGLTPRTPELEALHDAYLKALPVVHRLEGDIAGLRTEIISRLGECDAMDPVCSYIRKTVDEFDRSLFQSHYPQAYQRCRVEIPPQLRKHVYPNRSYLTDTLKLCC